MKDFQLQDEAAVIWRSKEPEEKDQYLVFRKEFTVPAAIKRKVFLAISADSTYEIWINAQRVPGAQIADMPPYRTYAVLDITELVHPGNNVIAVEVHYIGEDFLTYRTGAAFLCAAIHSDGEVLAATDSDWKYAYSPAMEQGLCCKMTNQLGYVFCRNESKNQAWAEIDFDDSSWKNAVELDNVQDWEMSLRKIPQLLELASPDVMLVQNGYLKRCGKEETFALSVFHDYLSVRRPRDFFAQLDESQTIDNMLRSGIKIHADSKFEFKINPLPADGSADGYYLITDLGHESVGLLKLDVSAPAGTIIDICHGEHLDDGRVRAAVGGRNFADRLICREGRNQLIFTHRRIGCRFLELHITKCGMGAVSLRYAGIVPLELPLSKSSEFVSEDRLLSRINQVSADTLKLCMHEHYEDCPWREQGLYAYDSRYQILYGYYIWGNYDFAAASLDLLGKSFDGKRYLGMTSPGKSNYITIPVFTLVWITELYDYYLYSGSSLLTERWLDQVNRIVDSALSEPVSGWKGLYHPGTGNKIWNFCEWNGKLSKMETQPQAPYNIYLYEALKSAKKLNEAAGNFERGIFLEQKAKELACAIESTFYNSAFNRYDACLDSKTDPEGYEHIQAVMLANYLVPLEKQARILALLQSGMLHGIELSALYYLISGLMTLGKKGRRFLLESLRKILEPIILSGATSLWETRHGGNDFDYAGSLCHGWSAVMPYFCGHILLGVTPLEAGFRKFEVKPWCGDLSHAAGTVPTPYGFIHVEWQKSGSGLEVKVRHPAEVECVKAQWGENPVCKWDIAQI